MRGAAWDIKLCASNAWGRDMMEMARKCYRAYRGRRGERRGQIEGCYCVSLNSECFKKDMTELDS